MKEYDIGVGGQAVVGDDIDVEDVVGELLLLEREPKPLQLASRDAADVVVGETIESVVLRSLSLRFRWSGFVFVEDDEKDDV